MSNQYDGDDAVTMTAPLGAATVKTNANQYYPTGPDGTIQARPHDVDELQHAGYVPAEDAPILLPPAPPPAPTLFDSADPLAT